MTQIITQEMSKGLDYISVRIYRKDISGNILINGSGLLFENNGGYFVYTNYHCVSSKKKLTNEIIPLDISLTEIALFYEGKQINVAIDDKIDDSESEDWILFSVSRPNTDWDYTAKVRFATNIQTGAIYETYPYVTEYEGYGRYTPIVATNPFGMWHVADHISGGRYAADLLMKGGSGSGIMQFRDDVFYCYGILRKALNEGAFSDLKSVSVAPILPLLSAQTTIQLTEEDVEQLNKASIDNEIVQLKSKLSAYENSVDLQKALLKILEDVVPSLLNNFQDTLTISLLECIKEVCMSDEMPVAQKAAYYNCWGDYHLLKGNTAESNDSYHNAYLLLPHNDLYIEHEVKRLMKTQLYDDAHQLVLQLPVDNHLRIAISLLQSESTADEFARLSPELQDDIKLRYTVIDMFAQSGKNYRFLATETKPTTPDNLTVENTHLWLYAFECYRNNIRDYLFTDLKALPQGHISLIQDAYNLATRFFKLADATCSASLYVNLRLYYCYWAFIVEDAKPIWVTRLDAVETSKDSYSFIFKTLFKSSMLSMMGNYDGAFGVICESGIAYDNIVLSYIIALSCTARKSDFLLSIAGRLKEKNIHFDSQHCSGIATLLSLLDDKNRLSFIDNLPIKQEADRTVLKWVHFFVSSQKTDTSGYAKLLPYLCDDMVANMAQVMAANGMLKEAYEILQDRFNAGDGSFCEQVYSHLVSRDPDRHIDHYTLLKEMRHQGKEMTNEQLRQEYNYSLSMLDYDDALEAIEILRSQDNTDEYIFTAYIDVIGKSRPEKLSEQYDTVLQFNFATVLHIQQVYYAFAFNNYIPQAAEFLYQNTIRLNHEALNAFFDQQVIMGFLHQIAYQSYETVTPDYYVTYANEQDVRTCRKLSPDSVLGRAMIGAKTNDLVTVNLGGTPTTLKIIGIHNKYYKLHADNLKDVMESGGNKYFTPIKIDFSDPDSVPAQFENILKEMSGGAAQPTEQEIHADYNEGKITLIQMASDDNIIGSYYNFLFSDFHLNVTPYRMLREQCPQLFVKDNIYLLDLTSLLLLFEFSQKHGDYQYHSRFLLPKFVQQLILQTVKGVEIFTSFKMVEAWKQGWLNHYSSRYHEDLQIRLSRLIDWIDHNCTIVSSSQILNMAQVKDENVKSTMFKYTMLEMLPESGSHRILLSEDFGIQTVFKMPVPIMSTETYMYHVEGYDAGQLFSQFICNNTCIGASVSSRYIEQQYMLYEQGLSNHINHIENTISRNLDTTSVLDASKLIIEHSSNKALALEVVEKLIRSALSSFTNEFFKMDLWTLILQRESLTHTGTQYLIPILKKIKAERLAN